MMSKSKWVAIAALVLGTPIAAMSLSPATAQQGGTTTSPNSKGNSITSTRGATFVSFSLARPSNVQRYLVTCSDATRLDVNIADCCIAGDHYEATVKCWDAKPNTAVTTSPGAADVFGANARVFDYGHSSDLTAVIEVRYLNGVNAFSAGGSMNIVSNGSCVPAVTDLGIIDEIN